MTGAWVLDGLGFKSAKARQLGREHDLTFKVSKCVGEEGREREREVGRPYLWVESKLAYG
jgi:hypothetical protein